MRFYLLILLFCCASLQAGFVRVGQNWSHERYAPTLPVQEHYDLGIRYLAEENWEAALNQFMIVKHHFQDSMFFSDSIYYIGVCYYSQGHLDLANKYLTQYLELNGNLKHFENVFEHKYSIAEAYQEGKKRHLFGAIGLPRIMSGKKQVIELYDEVIASLPSRDVAAKALLAKAMFLRKQKEFKESLDTLQVLIRRFPKHELAAEAFLKIGEIYLQQMQYEAQNPDFIALAQLNLQKFVKSFPGDDRRDTIAANIAAMQEVHAQSLFDTARFYERIKRPKAALIYYNDTIRRFPETESAQKSREKLNHLIPSQ
ncbi:MAG: outer membrane protein assembly factor BamD [Verrucomicrobia bacterium]|nr:outer membrane protein assembly factor BamD [Verrucomicrobiota bacterium]MBS0647132.1 outer membrane protein assembly factor BamD [Verrucomicrobiota bacterium]